MVMMTSTLLAFLFCFCFYVYPSYRKAKIQESLAILAKNVAMLNNSFLKSNSCKGYYLHDRLYFLLFMILTHKINIKSDIIKHIICGDNEKESNELKKFKTEINALDKDMKDVIEDGILAIGQILFLRNPILFAIASIMISWKKRNSLTLRKIRYYFKKGIINSAEYITVNAKNEDYNLKPIGTYSLQH